VAQFKRTAGGYSFLGSSPAILRGPQGHTCKIHPGILDWYWWMRNTQEPSQLDECLRSRRSSISLMALMAHQYSLILLFLWPHSMDLDDSSCILGRYNVCPSSVQIWGQSIRWRVRNSVNDIFEEIPGWNSNQTTLALPHVIKRICLPLLYLHFD